MGFRSDLGEEIRPWERIHVDRSDGRGSGLWRSPLVLEGDDRKALPLHLAAPATGPRGSPPLPARAISALLPPYSPQPGAVRSGKKAAAAVAVAAAAGAEATAAVVARGRRSANPPDLVAWVALASVSSEEDGGCPRGDRVFVWGQG